MKLSHKLIMVSAAALMGVSPLLTTTQSVNAATSSTKKSTSKKTTAKKTTSSKSTSSKTIKLTHNAYVYDKNGKRVDTYMGSAKYTTIAKGVSVKTNGTKTIDGVLYYSLGNGAYIKAANVDGKATTNSSSSSKSSSKNTSSSQSTKTSAKLLHNAYVYDKNGDRIKKYEGKSKLTKGTTVDIYGSENINGKKYYRLDSKGSAFVKAGNIDQKTVSTAITLKKNAYIYDSQGDTNKKLVKKGKTVKVTEARYIGTKLYYKIGDDQFIKATNVGKVSGAKLDPINEPDGQATVDVPDNEDMDATKVTTKTVASLYDIKGQKYPDRTFSAGVRQQVSELRYIATSATSTPELFYKLSSGRGYLRADDVTVSGKTMTAVNTPEQAKADVTVASATDKAQLAQSINEAAAVKTSDLYKLANPTDKAAYDKAIADGTILNNSTTATIGQVNEAEAAIVNAKSKLNGAKIAVANISSLTPSEVSSIVKLVASANNVAESAVQFSNNNTSLSIVINGYEQALNINDYVTQSAAVNH